MSTLAMFGRLPLSVKVTEVDATDAQKLLENCDDTSFTRWCGPQTELIGQGVAWQLEVSGPQAMDTASSQWLKISEEAHVKGPKIPGLKLPIALGSFGFAPHTKSVLLVPAQLLVRQNQRAWLVESGPALPANKPSRQKTGNRIEKISEGALTSSQWKQAVSEATQVIRDGKAQKIVLARDVIVHLEHPVNQVQLTAQLLHDYPTCWIYAVAGLIGASPEMLAQVKDGKLWCRVLAGTAAPDHGEALLRSEKNLLEHRFAVESVRQKLAGLLKNLHFPSSPRLLHLPNVCHLATDVTGQTENISALQVAAALHPTAAVCGTPTPAAAKWLAKLEQMDRGRYAGPVGWIDAAGQGEWAIALRCGEVCASDPRQVRVIAGGGIMPTSDPEAELAETQAKMRPLLHALTKLSV